MCNKTPNIFSIVCMPVTALISGWGRNYYIFSMCRYAQSCAFISVIELPRIPAYYPKEDGDLIQIYYAGTQDDWGNIFTEYKRTKVEDAEFGEELGTSIADKINSMLGGDYDSSEFEYYFSASPDDLKTE